MFFNIRSRIFAFFTFLFAIASSAPLILPKPTTTQLQEMIKQFERNIKAEPARYAGWVGCETSQGSPFHSDANYALFYLSRMGRCRNFNYRCRTHVTFGTASVKLCGVPYTDISCATEATIAYRILNQCQGFNPRRVGGQASTDGEGAQGGTVMIYHT